jgi:integrase
VQRRADENNLMGAPKSEAGDRIIQVSSLLINILKRWKLACPPGGLDLCFPTGIGTVESHANMANQGWYALQIKAGIVNDRGRAKYGLHAARHFFASNMIDKGTDPKRLQEWMGHASLQMTIGSLRPSISGGRRRARQDRIRCRFPGCVGAR